MRRSLVFAVLGLMTGAAVGCSGSGGYVPVSGVVKLNGKPYANAVVTFQPEGTKDNPNPGRGSAGVTDAEGRFTLKCDDGKKGAVVGSHNVTVRTAGDVIAVDPNVGSDDKGPVPDKKKIDPIPVDWRAIGNHKFIVPPGGTSEANFDITNPRFK